MVNAMDVYEVRCSRIDAEYEAKRKRENDILFNKCLREIKNVDAYKYLVHIAGKTLDCKYGAELMVMYFMDHRDEYDCSFIDWLYADNGPICKYSIKGLFPELEVISNDEYEIMQMANEYYDLDLRMDPCDDFIYAFEFDFREINKKRVNVDDIKKKMGEVIKKQLKGE